jgi:hypothetical protein
MKIPQISLGLAIYITIAACGLVTMAAIDKYGYSETSKKPSVKKEDESVVKKADDCVKPHQHKDSKKPHGGEKPQGGKKHTPPKQVPNGGPPTLKRKVHNSSKPKGNRK